MMKYSVIDIGSNSVRLMLWADGMSILKKINTTRLGEGLAHKGVLSDNAIGRTACAVGAFAEEGRAWSEHCFAFATAAVRTARNGADFCALVKRKYGIDVDVVSGDEEAKLGLCGALGSGDGGIIDIGGASTEVCMREKGTVVFSHSYPVGAVRLWDVCGDDRARLSAEIGRTLSERSPRPCGKMYAIGGTASTLASVLLGLERYDAQKIQDFPMPKEAIVSLADRLFSLSVEERKKIKGMDERRADIIAGGALLLAEIMEKLSLREVCASDRDNLEGYCYLRGLK